MHIFVHLDGLFFSPVLTCCNQLIVDCNYLSAVTLCLFFEHVLNAFLGLVNLCAYLCAPLLELSSPLLQLDGLGTQSSALLLKAIDFVSQVADLVSDSGVDELIECDLCDSTLRSDLEACPRHLPVYRLHG